MACLAGMRMCTAYAAYCFVNACYATLRHGCIATLLREALCLICQCHAISPYARHMGHHHLHALRWLPLQGSVEESAGKDNSNGSKSYTVKGIISKQEGEGGSSDLNGNGTVTLHISELPVRKWTQDYKEFLETMMAGSSSEAKDKSTAGLVKVRGHPCLWRKEIGA